jgi:hypothetical protein
MENGKLQIVIEAWKKLEEDGNESGFSDSCLEFCCHGFYVHRSQIRDPQFEFTVKNFEAKGDFIVGVMEGHYCNDIHYVSCQLDNNSRICSVEISCSLYDQENDKSQRGIIPLGDIGKCSTVSSGTEYMAPVWNLLMQQMHAEVIVEFGSGYTTAFLLDSLYRTKIRIRRDLQFLDAAVKNFSVDQLYNQYKLRYDFAYYDQIIREGYNPILVIYDLLGSESSYMRRIQKNINEVSIIHENCVSAIPCVMAKAPEDESDPFVLPKELDGRGVDLAWNDDRGYEEFMKSFWPVLSSNGICAFHNTIGTWEENVSSVDEMKLWLEAQGQKFEYFSVKEPHKVTQNSFSLFKKESTVVPLASLLVNQNGDEMQTRKQIIKDWKNNPDLITNRIMSLGKI